MTSAPCVTRSPTTSSLPQNAEFLLIDYQPAQLAAVRSMDHAGGHTVVAVDGTSMRCVNSPTVSAGEVADTTNPSVATLLIDRIAGEVGPLTCW